MDLRVKRTRGSIINAFIKLRAKKPLEKITVKELSDLAGINKATFYLHYRDIYDLSEALENELFENIIKSIEHPEKVISEPKLFIRELNNGFAANQSLIDIIFSNDRSNILVDRIEKELKKLLYEAYPQYKNNLEADVLLTYLIKGGYYAFQDNSKYETSSLISVICETAEYISERILNLISVQ